MKFPSTSFVASRKIKGKSDSSLEVPIHKPFEFWALRKSPLPELMVIDWVSDLAFDNEIHSKRLVVRPRNYFAVATLKIPYSM